MTALRREVPADRPSRDPISAEQRKAVLREVDDLQKKLSAAEKRAALAERDRALSDDQTEQIELCLRQLAMAIDAKLRHIRRLGLDEDICRAWLGRVISAILRPQAGENYSFGRVQLIPENSGANDPLQFAAEYSHQRRECARKPQPNGAVEDE